MSNLDEWMEGPVSGNMLLVFDGLILYEIYIHI